MVLNFLSSYKQENVKITKSERIDNGVFKLSENNTVKHIKPLWRIEAEICPDENSYIRVEILLPDNWNGRFLGLGNGGMAGNFMNSFPRANEGYAVVQTDMGTSGGRISGVNNPSVHQDFGWRATHLMTDVGLKMVQMYYGKAPEFRYFVGGSTGGQQAFSLAQRYPHDYNGILATVPANNRTHLHMYFLWNHNHLHLSNGKTLFTEEEVHKITDCAVEFFQARGDGIPGDNFVSNPFFGNDTTDCFISYLSKNTSFDTLQLEALRAVYNGPINPRTGEQIYNGMPIGSEIYGCGIMDCQRLESPHFYPFIWAFGSSYNGYDFDFDKDIIKLDKALASELNANNADLSDFAEAGGKIITYSGTADPCVPYPDTMRYAQRVIETVGENKAAEFFRFYLLPGRAHGGGNGTHTICSASPERLNDFQILVNWCENGVSPNEVIATRSDNPQIERIIYPYGSKQFPMKNCPPVCDNVYLKQ